MVLEALPPHDIAAEEAVVAALMVDDAALADVAVQLRPADFFREPLGLVYAAQLALAARSEPTSPIFVANELAARGQLEAIGGYPYLAQLTSDLPTAVGVEHYAALVARDATYRRLLSAAGKIAGMAYRGGPDLADTLSSAQALITLVDREAPGHGAQALSVLTAERREALEARAQNPRAGRGYATGLRALDRLLSGGGLLPGKTYVCGGATSIGKSTFLRTVLLNLALAGRQVVLFTLEQDADEVLEELAYRLAGVDRHAHEAAGAPLAPWAMAALRSALDALQSLDTFHIDDAAGLSAPEIKLRLARLCGRQPVAVCGIDYLHIMRPEQGRRDGNREREVAAMAESVRDTAKELNVASLLMSQLNWEQARPEAAKNGYKPTLRSFRDSGAVTHLPYAVIGLHRRDYYVEKGLLEADQYVNDAGETVPKGWRGARPVLDHTLEAIILKQQRGPTGTARLRFRGELSSIEDWG